MGQSIILNLCLQILICLFVSACADHYAPLEVPLLNTPHTTTTIQTKENLNVYISDKFENTQFIGGNNSYTTVHFRQIAPWLRYRLFSLNTLECKLRKKIDLEISVKKFYVAHYHDNLQITIVLNSKMISSDEKPIVKNYRGDCQIGFFTSENANGIQACLNESLNSIIPRMKQDICEIGF